MRAAQVTWLIEVGRGKAARVRARVWSSLMNCLVWFLLGSVFIHSPHKHTHKCARTHWTRQHTERLTHRLQLRSAPTTHARTHRHAHTHTEHNSPAKAGAQGTHASARALVSTHAGARALKHFDTHLSALAFSQTEPGTSGSGTGGGCGCGGGSGCTNISEAFCPFIISSHIIWTDRGCKKRLLPAGQHKKCSMSLKKRHASVFWEDRTAASLLSVTHHIRFCGLSVWSLKKRDTHTHTHTHTQRSLICPGPCGASLLLYTTGWSRRKKEAEKKSHHATLTNRSWKNRIREELRRPAIHPHNKKTKRIHSSSTTRNHIRSVGSTYQ